MTMRPIARFFGTRSRRWVRAATLWKTARPDWKRCVTHMRGAPYDLAMGGLELIRAVRRVPLWPVTRLALLTSLPDPGEAGASRAMGADCYLPTRVRREDLFIALADLTCARTAPNASTRTNNGSRPFYALGAHVLLAEDN